MPASWQEKYDNAKPSYIRTNDKKFADLEPGTTILIPSPSDIEAEIASLGDGETVSLTKLRQRLASVHDADGTCPVMCGMNLRVVAEVAFEALDAGIAADELAPVWNAIDPKSNLAKKLPGGPERVSALRSEVLDGRT